MYDSDLTGDPQIRGASQSGTRQVLPAMQVPPGSQGKPLRRCCEQSRVPSPSQGRLIISGHLSYLGCGPETFENRVAILV